MHMPTIVLSRCDTHPGTDRRRVVLGWASCRGVPGHTVDLAASADAGEVVAAIRGLHRR